jgi:hypothetical protein
MGTRPRRRHHVVANTTPKRITKVSDTRIIVATQIFPLWILALLLLRTPSQTALLNDVKLVVVNAGSPRRNVQRSVPPAGGAISHAMAQTPWLATRSIFTS